MTPDERDLRRALAGRSGDPSPAFRARLAAALAEGRPAADRRPALAGAAAVLLAAAAVAVVLLSRQAAVPAPVPAGPAAPTPASASRTSTPAPAPTWAVSLHPAPTILVSPIPMPTSVELEAPSDRVLWALVGGVELFRSSDQGATWEQRPLPPLAVEGIAFVDDQQGWLLADDAGAAAIWHTADAGASWQRLDTSGLGDARRKSFLSFSDPTHGFLAGSDPNQPVIYRTADGGRTWTASQPIPNPPGYAPRPGYDLEPGRVSAFGSTLLVQVSSAVFRSTDGGATWTYVASTPNTAERVAFVTATRWLDLIVPGQSEETLDAGATWHVYASDYSQAAGVAPVVVFGSSQVGYATVRGSLQRTVDGGLHWTPLRTPGTAP